FLGAGAVLYRTHERDLDHMGGLIHRMPVTALMFLVGCVAISALPPFNGFVSEWLTFQTALQAPVLHNGVLRALIPIAAALLALTGARAGSPTRARSPRACSREWGSWRPSACCSACFRLR